MVAISVARFLQGLTGPLVVAAVALVTAFSAPVMAQQTYIPTIWIDPDGCEHWAMDDGAEGYMSPHLQRNGQPVCHRGNICGVMPSDQFFAANQYTLSPSGRNGLVEFFRNARATGFLIHGHTDSRSSDEYNMALSARRANAVAQVAQELGMKIVDVRGFGERMPRASNSTPAGMAENRRVEIICLQ